jgi:putative SOS response-associated peptidase YedK
VCGRYTNTGTQAQLARAFPEVAALADPVGCERFNVAPTDPVLVLVATADGGRRAGPLRWGLVPHWAADLKIGARMLNARSETVAERAAFRDLVATARRRCLVLADGWYEWLRAEDRRQPRVPMHYSLPGGEPFAFAGLWTTWRPPDGGERVGTCTILTTRANAVAAPVHDRMPVVLDGDDARAAWLDPSLDAGGVGELLAPLPDARLRVRPANPLVNSVRNDGPQCLAA